MCEIMENYLKDEVEKIAIKMIRKGSDDEYIREITDLSLKRIAELREQEMCLA